MAASLILLLSIANSFIKVALQAPPGLPKQLHMETVIATSHWPDSRFQVNAGQLLRLIQGTLLLPSVRVIIQLGQDLCELQGTAHLRAFSTDCLAGLGMIMGAVPQPCALCAAGSSGQAIAPCYRLGPLSNDTLLCLLQLCFLT